jgi:hypothetical protein
MGIDTTVTAICGLSAMEISRMKIAKVDWAYFISGMTMVELWYFQQMLKSHGLRISDIYEFYVVLDTKEEQS